MNRLLFALVLAACVLAAAGCGGGSGGSKAGTPSPLEVKVAELTGYDPSLVHCRVTGHKFDNESLASCTFSDGNGGCYDAITGKDLTVAARARFNAAQLPECWQ